MTPPRWFLRGAWAFHRLLFRVTGGRVGTERPAGGRVGTLFLETTGRRSGAVRRTALFYLERGSGFVVVASNAGASNDPAWWLNLQASPRARVSVGGRTWPVRARAATAREADELWPALIAASSPYATYRANAKRPIAIVLLEREEGERQP